MIVRNRNRQLLAGLALCAATPMALWALPAAAQSINSDELDRVPTVNIGSFDSAEAASSAGRSRAPDGGYAVATVPSGMVAIDAAGSVHEVVPMVGSGRAMRRPRDPNRN